MKDLQAIHNKHIRHTEMQISHAINHINLEKRALERHGYRFDISTWNVLDMLDRIKESVESIR